MPLLLIHQQRSARAAALTAPLLLERVRNACEGPVLVLKGPELAARYPNRSRLFGDLDILVTDAKETQRALIAAGFEELDDPEGLWVGIHHLPRLSWPGLPLQIEVHSRPKWLEGSSPPRIEELFEAAVPTSSGVPGLLAPCPAHHAILVAAHAWAHQPLGRLRDLVDVGALAAEADPWELDDQAQEMGRRAHVGHHCRIARGNLGWSAHGAPQAMGGACRGDSRPDRLRATHRARDFPVLGAAVQQRCPLARFVHLANEFRPAFDETWAEKLHRTTRAIRRARLAVSTHDRLLGASALRGRRRNRPPAVADDSGRSKD